MENVIVFAVHPDDETLGCGGLLHKLKSENKKIHWCIITNTYEEHGFSKEYCNKRKLEIEKVSLLYQFDSIINLELPSTQIEQYSKGELIQKISKIVSNIKPDTVILPFEGDVHSEHKAVFDAAYACTKIFRYPFIKHILMMETLSETDFAPAFSRNSFIPNYFVDISKYLDLKIKCMKVFESEIGEHPFPRSEDSIRALAILRGSQAGVKYAESFMSIKQIIE